MAEETLPWQKAETIAATADVTKACEYLAKLPDPLAATGEFHILAQRNFRAKNIPAMIQYSQAGVLFALTTAGRLEEKDAAAATQLRGRAKAIAYDVAANLWPGWDEPGIQLTATDLAVGREFAKTNLRLALELGRTGEPLGNAHWLLGAQEMASENPAAALIAFQQAREHFKDDYILMANGYAAGL